MSMTCSFASHEKTQTHLVDSSTARQCGRPLALAVIALLAVWPSAVLDSFGQTGSIYRLADVKIVGSKRYAVSDVISAAGLKIADNVTLDAVKKAADHLGSIGVFTQVSYRYQTRGNDITVIFTVEDAGRLLACTFENFVWFTREELLAGLRARVPLFDGYAPAGGTMLDLLSAALESMLQERGLHAQVQASPAGAMGGPVQAMQFRVMGLAIPVRNIEFTGVQGVSPAALEEASRPLMDKDYDRAFIRSFSGMGIAAVYRKAGYLRAQFGEPVPRLLSTDRTPNAVAISIPVTEGPQYRFREVSWTGESAIPYEELAKSLHATPGSPLNAVQFEQDVLSLLPLFHAKGYLDADARFDPVLDDGALTALCHVGLRQGDLYHLGKLDISGIDDAHATSLARLCRLRPGDPYDPTYWNKFIQEAGRRLPPSRTGWASRYEQSIHRDKKTVDVLITFAPAPGK